MVVWLCGSRTACGSVIVVTSGRSAVWLCGCLFACCTANVYTAHAPAHTRNCMARIHGWSEQSLFVKPMYSNRVLCVEVIHICRCRPVCKHTYIYICDTYTSRCHWSARLGAIGVTDVYHVWLLAPLICDTYTYTCHRSVAPSTIGEICGTYIDRCHGSAPRTPIIVTYV